MGILTMKILCLLLLISISIIGCVNGDENESFKKRPTIVKMVKGTKMCVKDWECNKLSKFCCNLTITDYLDVDQFELLFAKRNTPVAHAVGFWDYSSFINAAALYQPLGFGTTGGKRMQMKEIAAFLGHVGSKTTCKFTSLLDHYVLHKYCRGIITLSPPPETIYIW